MTCEHGYIGICPKGCDIESAEAEKLALDAERDMFDDDVENYGLEDVGCK